MGLFFYLFGQFILQLTKLQAFFVFFFAFSGR